METNGERDRSRHVAHRGKLIAFAASTPVSRLGGLLKTSNRRIRRQSKIPFVDGFGFELPHQASGFKCSFRSRFVSGGGQLDLKGELNVTSFARFVGKRGQGGGRVIHLSSRRHIDESRFHARDRHVLCL